MYIFIFIYHMFIMLFGDEHDPVFYQYDVVMFNEHWV